MKYDLNISNAISSDGLNSGMYPVIIYQLIRQYTNENHKITVEDIQETLEEYWKGDADKASRRSNLRKTIKRNLRSLLYFDRNIQAEDKKEQPLYIEEGDSESDIYWLWYQQELDFSDVQMLSDSVVYSKHLSKKNRIDILEKLMRTAGYPETIDGQWFASVIKDSQDISLPASNNLIYNLNYINEAINTKTCISFKYVLKGPHSMILRSSKHVGVSPYKLINSNGVYYLIACRSLIKRNKPQPKGDGVFCIEVHRLVDLRLEKKSQYLDISETVADKKTLQELELAALHAGNRRIYKDKTGIDITLGTSKTGLAALYDIFGDRLSVLKLPEPENPFESYEYKVSIRRLMEAEFHQIIVLILQLHPIHIGFLGDSREWLENVRTGIDINLINSEMLEKGIRHS